MQLLILEPRCWRAQQYVLPAIRMWFCSFWLRYDMIGHIM